MILLDCLDVLYQCIIMLIIDLFFLLMTKRGRDYADIAVLTFQYAGYTGYTQRKRNAHILRVWTLIYLCFMRLI